jgi:hypothetical protein
LTVQQDFSRKSASVYEFCWDPIGRKTGYPE